MIFSHKERKEHKGGGTQFIASETRGGTQFIASETSSGRIKMRPSRAALFVPFVIFVAKTSQTLKHSNFQTFKLFNEGFALRGEDES